MGRNSTKTPQELDGLYLIRVQSSVRSLRRQYKKLSKAFKSYKPGTDATQLRMPEATRDAIIKYILDVRNEFDVSLKAVEAEKEPQFTLVSDSDKARLMPKPVEKPKLVTAPVQKQTIPVKK